MKQNTPVPKSNIHANVINIFANISISLIVGLFQIDANKNIITTAPAIHSNTVARFVPISIIKHHLSKAAGYFGL